MGRLFCYTALAVIGLAVMWSVGSVAGAQDAGVLPYPTTGFAPPALHTPSVSQSPALLPPPTASYQPTPELAPPLPPSEVPQVASPVSPKAIPEAADPPQPPSGSDEGAETVIVDEAVLDDVSLAPADEPPLRWYYPARWFGPVPWDSGFELGINGATGTSDTLSIRTGGYIKRESDRNKVDLSLYYNKTTAEGNETQNNAIFKARDDLMLGQSPWSVFLMSQVFYDEFQAFDLNVNVNSGFGFKVLDEEWVKLRTSLGAGASREFGGVDDEWVPEAQFGFDWEQQITATQKFYAGVDYFPEFEDFGNYRVLTDIGLEVELSCPSNVSLKLSATDRYDSQSDGVEPHNTNYSVLLLWKH